MRRLTMHSAPGQPSRENRTRKSPPNPGRFMPLTVWSSRSAPGSASPDAACDEKPEDHENDHSTDERDQHRAENRMPDDRDAPVEGAGQNTAHQCTHHACDHITHKSQAMAQCQVAGEESADQANEEP